MNAVTPILTPLALQNAEVLNALDLGGFESQGDIARELGRDPSNLSKSLKALREAELVEEEGLGLTDPGRAALAAIRRANGEASAAAPAGFVALLVGDIAFDTANARTHSGLSPLEIEEMAASIREHGLLTPPIVWDLGDGTSWQLVAGERRVRGWRLAVERGWIDADTRYLCQIFAGDDVQATEAALVENLQRVDLDNLEAAEGLLKLARKAEPPTPAADLAKRLGKEERWVQERLRVATEASAEAKARYVSHSRRAAAPDYDQKADPDPFRWTDLRNSVKRPKHVTALEKNPRLALLVMELSLRSQQDFGVHDGLVKVRPWPPGGLPETANELGLTLPSIERSGDRFLSLQPPALEWLTAIEWDDPRIAAALLADTRTVALGPFGAASLAFGQLGTDFLNPPTPFVREGMVGDQFSQQLRATLAAGDDPAAPDTDPTPVAAGSPIPPPLGEVSAQPTEGATQTGDLPHETATPPAAEVSQAPASHPHPRTGSEEDAGADPSNPPPTGEVAVAQQQTEGVPTEPPKLLDTLRPLARLALLETALAIRDHGQETRAGGLRGAPVHDFHKDATGAWSDLFTAKLIQAPQAPSGMGFLAALTDKALTALAETYPEGVSAEVLDAAKLAAGVPLAGPRRATPWLNPPPKDPSPVSREKVAPKGSDEGSTGPEPGSRANNGDIIVGGMRQALADLWQAGKLPLDILTRLENGEGAGDDEIAEAAKALQGALMAASLFVPAEMKAQG